MRKPQLTTGSSGGELLATPAYLSKPGHLSFLPRIRALQATPLQITPDKCRHACGMPVRTAGSEIRPYLPSVAFAPVGSTEARLCSSRFRSFRRSAPVRCEG